MAYWRMLLLLLPALLPTLAAAQEIQAQAYNRWLVENVPGGYGLTARIAGVGRYQRYATNATLAFACVSGNAFVDLAVDPKPLAFDTDPYEGPDATMSGPVTIASGKAPPFRLTVSGFFNSGGPYDTGTPFVFEAHPTKAQIRAWVAQSARGQELRITVPAAKGTAVLEADFRWPDDDAAFAGVMASCLKP